MVSVKFVSTVIYCWWIIGQFHVLVAYQSSVDISVIRCRINNSEVKIIDMRYALNHMPPKQCNTVDQILVEVLTKYQPTFGRRCWPITLLCRSRHRNRYMINLVPTVSLTNLTTSIHYFLILYLQPIVTRPTHSHP